MNKFNYNLANENVEIHGVHFLAWTNKLGHVVVHGTKGKTMAGDESVLERFLEIHNLKKLFEFLDAYPDLLHDFERIHVEANELEPCKRGELEEEISGILEISASGLDSFLKLRDFKQDKGSSIDNRRLAHIKKSSSSSSVLLHQSPKDYWIMPLRDILAMKEMIELTIAIKSLIDGDNLTLKGLEEYGFSTVPHNKDSNEFALVFTYPFEKESLYHNFLRKNNCGQIDIMNSAQEGVQWFMDLPTGKATSKSEYVNRNYLRAYAERFLDDMATLHTADTRHVVRGLTSNARSGSFFGAMWLQMLDELQNGRALLCEHCNKAFISQKERGKLRMYCSDRCNKRAQRARK